MTTAADSPRHQSHSLRTSVTTSLSYLLRPLARILLRHGVTAHEFAGIANAAFVAAASDALREQGKEPSYSRISSLTGLHRHTVSAVAAATRADGGETLTSKHYQRNRLARVLTGWFESPEYTDADGKPRMLPVDGPTPSFTSLVRQFSGDIYAKIILDELLRVKAVRITRDGMVRAISRRCTAAGVDPEALNHLGEALRALATTLEHNLTAPQDERFFEDSVVATNLPPDVVPMLRQLLARRGASFLDDLQGWLAQHERSARDVAKGQPTIRAGIALHMFVDPPPIESAAAERSHDGGTR